MQLSWLMRFLLALLLLLGSNAWAAPQQEQFGGPLSECTGSMTWVKGTAPTPYQLTYPELWRCVVAETGAFVKGKLLYTCAMSAMAKNGQCVCDTASGAYFINSPSPVGVCGCPAGKEMNLWTKQCVTPCASGETRGDPQGQCYPPCPDGQARDSAGVCPSPICNSPKVEQNGSCVCPTGTVASGETCITPPPDCSQKQTECTSSCTAQNKPLSRFYCESSTASDPSTQLFSGQTYACECGNSTGCPTGQQQTISVVDGSTACAPSSTNPEGCPIGSYYGDFNGQTGCIKPSEQNDPDESPNNCMTGTNPVYYGSTLYCVPQPDSTTCPTGTTSFVTDTGLKICKGTDTQGNPTGDSPDTNGSIKGTPTSGSGSGSGDGNGNGGGDTTGTDNAAIAAKLDAIKANTDTLKASAAQTAANTQTTANNTKATADNTAAIQDALTGTASTVAQGSFAASTAAIQAEVETLKTQYGSTLTTVKNQMTAFLSSNTNTPTGAGGLPCYDAINIPVLNKPFALCFTQFEDELALIGTYIYGIAFLFAGLVILGGSRGQS